jgi:quinol-cytochrome oxidoreductase complex cytochrome b subunit
LAAALPALHWRICIFMLYVFTRINAYQKPRELIWLFGMTITLLLIGEAFMGYLLPWGRMSYWGAQVIIFAVWRDSFIE